MGNPNPSAKHSSYLFILLTGVAFWLIGAPSARADPPLPEPMPSIGDCYYDHIYYGAIPPGGEQGPVLVFVHGYAGLASDWWANVPEIVVNDMYAQAYAAGYRTAFVTLNVDPELEDCGVTRQPGRDMMHDGYVLSQQLEFITQHYKVSEVDIIAHSKGGIDAQAAIVWWGAWQRVRRVFTLGTPHQGSLVADLLWSPMGYWVSVNLGHRDDATFSLQTASMQLFRAITDLNPVDDAIRYYSGAGNFWETPETDYMLIGEWLQNHPQGGDNDGLVDVAHTYLAGASTLFLQPWDHTQISVGRNAFPYIHNARLAEENRFKVYLPVLQRASSAYPAAPLSDSIPLEPLDTITGLRIGARYQAMGGVNSQTSNSVLRGGRLHGTMIERVPIEPQAQAAHFTALTTDERVTATLLGPDGSTSPLRAAAHGNSGVLASAFRWEHTVSQPGPGWWRVQLDGPPGTGYLLLVTLESPLRVSLDSLPDHPISPGAPLQLRAHIQSPASAAQVSQTRLQVSRSTPGLTRSDFQVESTGASGSGAVTYHFPAEGIYGLSVTVTGETTEGLPFERSFVGSVAVVPPEKLADRSAVFEFLTRK